MKVKTISVAGITGTGKTYKDAKADLDARIERILSDTFNAKFISCIPYPSTILIYRCGAEEWGYKFLQDAAPGVIWCSCTYKTRDEAERSARKSAAQRDSVIGLDERSGLEWLETEEDRKEHLSWLAWQRCYSTNRAAGMTDMEARNQPTDMTTVQPLKEKFKL